MVTPSTGSIVLVKFPFSDLSSSKLRPAVVLSRVNYYDCILCQITSNSYSDTRAVKITDLDFDSGSLFRPSYVRPGKLFSASTSLMERILGELKQSKFEAIIDAVIDILRPKI